MVLKINNMSKGEGRGVGKGRKREGKEGTGRGVGEFEQSLWRALDAHEGLFVFQASYHHTHALQCWQKFVLVQDSIVL